MTFLEFVCERLMGPPAYGSMWHCPYHRDSSPSFSVRPPKADHPIKFKCFGCGRWGDEYDLMRLYYPAERYPQHRVRLDHWRREYEQEIPATARTDPPDSPSRGPGRRLVFHLRDRLDAHLYDGYLAGAHAMCGEIEVIDDPPPQLRNGTTRKPSDQRSR